MRLRITNRLPIPYSADIRNAGGRMIRVSVPPLSNKEVTNVDPFYLNQDKKLRDAVFVQQAIALDLLAETDDIVGLPAPTGLFAWSSSMSNVTSVDAALSSTMLLAANSVRVGATIFNDTTTGNLFLKLGIAASTSSFTTRLSPGGYYEVPAFYRGRIDGIWSAADGFARVTELLP